jgi:hypothetical protein
MHIEDLKTLKNHRPFRPFVIRTTDGREVAVRHPDTVAWDVGTGRTVVCMGPEGSWDLIDVSHITSVNVPPPMPSEYDED